MLACRVFVDSVVDIATMMMNVVVEVEFVVNMMSHAVVLRVLSKN
jgi:hypothetical protein